jgi:hypothetical protein
MGEAGDYCAAVGRRAFCKRRATTSLAELMADRMALEGVDRNLVTWCQQGEIFWRGEEQQRSLAAADRAIASHGLARLAVSLVSDLAAMAAAPE